MKKDGIYLIGGLAVGAVLFYVFKDQIMGLTKSEKSSDEESSVPPVTTGGIGQIPQPSGSISGGYMNTGIGAPNQVMEGQTQQNQTSQTQQTQVEAEPVLPYALTEIDPSLRNSSAYTDLFGGCDFPIVDGAESVCVQRVQDALDVDTTGLFDDPTQWLSMSTLRGCQIVQSILEGSQEMDVSSLTQQQTKRQMFVV